MTHRIALIGLGNMGTPMAKRLLEAGHAVTGFDVQEQARERLAQAGGAPAATAAAAAADASVIILMLPNSTVVQSVVDELLEAEALRSKPLVIDMSSSDPVSTRELAARLAEHGVELLDAPVSGGVRGAEDGSLTVMLGSNDASRDFAHEVLAPLGKVTDCGPVGAGHAVKALNNLLSATHLLVTSEAMQAGMRFGLDPEVMLQVFNGSSGRSGSTDNKWPNFILPGTFNTGFGLRLMLKDMRIAADLGDQVGAPAALGKEAIALWAEAADALPADADHSSIASWVASRGSAK